LKLIKKDVLDVIMPMLMVKRHAFDLELCFLAQKNNFRIVEAPVHIKYNFSGSSINSKSIYHMFKDTLAIRYRYTVLKYYQRQYQKEHFANGRKNAGSK
jgi:hypothetical protein